MLQGTRNSTPLDRFCENPEKYLKKIEELAKNTAEQLLEFLSPSPIYIAYNGVSWATAAAKTLYWLIATLCDKTQIQVGDIESYLYHRIAYREEEQQIILFSEPGGENTVFRALNTASVMGKKIALVSTPLPSTLIEQTHIRRENSLYIEISETHPLHPLLIAYHLGVKYAKRYVKNPRIVRLEKEGVFYTIVKTLTEKYRSEIEDIARLRKSRKTTLVITTPTMTPTAIIIEDIFWENTTPTIIKTPTQAITLLAQKIRAKDLPEKFPEIIILTTSVEEDLTRELTYKLASIIKRKPTTIYMKTDPLTAPIYGSILASYSYCIK